ncbi:bifunctional 4-hydroxy-2-oxoglutarate aldolase/2-dehydro-3-deoxy-phosphogluconate aldolase [Acidobacteria bacterium AH-259-G07]|nr:bifunctional 4-hydroxy-2-oxoglutarate aldolase/2-dehydro-3-deoxy-phosphogluconate aldolase [Acidobacteria bacterium AH-259-L09]MDA2927257.1 bifunctional 4-hydroxy-2-oxoglutarate aldolase/2-dehydro-3-deoxy-phosphogluconate aldolase [Acidobacteria bacterium AH-259-G07]
MSNEISNRIEAMGLVPVIVINDAEDAIPLGKALAEGGLPGAEVTFRTAAAAQAIRAISEKFPAVLVGAGTVLTAQQAKEAISAGAQFVVAPGFNIRVVDFCLEQQIPVFPGVCTPTEIEAALDKALSVLKFFPAEAIGGVSYLKAISAPYSTVRFIPTGGVNAENLRQYLSLSAVLACGGSWMVSSQLIAARQFDEITRRVSEAVNLVKQVREGLK